MDSSRSTISTAGAASRAPRSSRSAIAIPARLAIVGDQFDIARRYTDAEEMLASEKLDFVDIATTVASHRALVELAARHGVGVICQKPFAPSMRGRARDGRRPAGAPASRSWCMRIFAGRARSRPWRAMIESGEIGEPFWGRVSFRSAYDVFSGQPYLATGERFIIEDLGIHILDIARFLFGDVATATARTRRVNPAIRGEDVATILLDHENGVTSVVDCSYATRLGGRAVSRDAGRGRRIGGQRPARSGLSTRGDGKPRASIAKTFPRRCCPGRRVLGTISRRASRRSSSIGSTVCAGAANRRRRAATI